MPVHRKTLKRYEIEGDLRMLTFSCFGRLPLLGSPAMRDAFAAHLERVHTAGTFRLFAWVIMPDHIHVLLLPAFPDWPVTRILRALKRPFARRILARWRRRRDPILDRLADAAGKPRFWLRGGGFDRNRWPDRPIGQVIEYIHANPERRGLVARDTDWRWSSATWYAGQPSGPVTIDPIDLPWD